MVLNLAWSSALDRWASIRSCRIWLRASAEAVFLAVLSGAREACALLFGSGYLEDASGEDSGRAEGVSSKAARSASLVSGDRD